ncbi:alpha/beta hydrolase [Echinicola marina]|uniref:alpha/beta fold hydrolase n=1 Tax=Echinicola marina TaxID=2859768 RepID=UPI001CF6B238|nr:alpha/beta hydrolase [Echinicola marina]UCS91750.1 alpha/beta hydrolase [Echinicola marina]
MLRKISILFFIFMTLGKINAQEQLGLNYESKFVKLGEIRTHYLDFGGEGLAVILVHSEAWSAYAFQDFGPLLTDNNRVFAITRPGYGDSGMGHYDVESQGDYLIAFADALNIDRAVFIGNASVTAELTYLAENYPQRLAGIVYLTGLAVPWLEENQNDPHHAYEMFLRASPTANTAKTDIVAISKVRGVYRPEHYTDDSVRIEVPALAIVSKNGMQGSEKGLGALVYVGSPLMEEVRKQIPPSRTREMLDRLADDPAFRHEVLSNIQDALARQYFLDLATDSAQQNIIYQYHMEKVYPAMIEAQEKIKRAFGEYMKLEKIDVNQIVGYEYRDSPELILQPVKGFLDQLSKTKQ